MHGEAKHVLVVAVHRSVGLGVTALAATLAFATSSCGEDAPGPSFTPGTGCGFEAEDRFTFTEVELAVDDSADACPEVTVEDANGADEPDCERALDGCELVLRCAIEIDGLTVYGNGRLAAVDGGDGLTGSIEARLGDLVCRYDVMVAWE